MLNPTEENACFEKRCVFIEAEVVGQIPSHEGDHELIWVDFDHAISILSHESHRWALWGYTQPGASQCSQDSNVLPVKLTGSPRW
jgi:hypothetical protein